MPSQKRYEKISPDNLKNLESLRRWVRENLPHLYLNKVVPDSHLLIFLDYMNRMIEQDSDLDRSFWLELVRNLESNAKTLKKVEENNEL